VAQARSIDGFGSERRAPARLTLHFPFAGAGRGAATPTSTNASAADDRPDLNMWNDNPFYVLAAPWSKDDAAVISNLRESWQRSNTR